MRELNFQYFEKRTMTEQYRFATVVFKDVPCEHVVFNNILHKLLIHFESILGPIWGKNRSKNRCRFQDWFWATFATKI